MSRDRRYQMPVNGVSPEELPAKMRTAVDSVGKLFPPQTGVCVFVFDFGQGGGMSYISNAERADVINALQEWIRHQRSLS
ncbi:MAG: hypothetical protein ACR652_24525 [Methylocystis sp.]|uniref:hypothetical protein n=1 Tax=Methylocystis sp. TaxID=1911079 RepID=UPI003DA4868F